MPRARIPLVRLHLRPLLDARGLTVYALVAEAERRGHGLTRTTAYRLANGRATAVTFATLTALCDVLDVAPGDLFARE